MANATRINNAGITRYVLDTLAPGPHFLAMTAINAEGTESELSDVKAVTIH